MVNLAGQVIGVYLEKEGKKKGNRIVRTSRVETNENMLPFNKKQRKIKQNQKKSRLCKWRQLVGL